MTLTTPWLPSPAALAQTDGWRMASERARPVVALIEDDESIALMYRIQLEGDGYAVEHACDGVSGLHLVQTAEPEVILLDLRLPQMAGLDVLRKVQQDPGVAHLPVLILSNYASPR